MKTKHHRPKLKGKRNAALPDKFEPRLFDSADSRFWVVKEIRRRLQRLKDDAGIDSYQKELLAERAIFITVQLETLETNAAEGKPIDLGSYTQMTNCLIGLTTKLGLEKQLAKEITSLESYVKSKHK